MTCSVRYAPELRLRGYRMTPQRLAILHVLICAKGHLSPAEVYERARKQAPGLTEPTVYRALDFLVENGLVSLAARSNGRAAYQMVERAHHHLICRVCGKETEVDHALLKGAYKKLEEKTGYKLAETHLTFFGLCPRCKGKS